MSADRERDDRDHLPELGGGATEADLRSAARAAAGSEADGPHPPAEELVAYHEGRLPDGRADQVRRHLAACPECSGLVLDLAAFANLEPPAGRQPLDADEVAAARRRFDAEHPPLAVPGDGDRHGGDRPGGGRQGGGRHGGGYRLLALAASIAFVLALGWGLLQLRTIGELRAELQKAAGTGGDRVRPVTNLYLDFGEVVRGEGDEVHEVREGGDLTLRLAPAGTAERWEVTIRTEAGERMGHESIAPTPEGEVEVSFARPDPGRYLVELQPTGGNGTEVLEIVIVRPQEAPAEGDGG